ncbi:hypothetical protein B0H19DRAFT_1275948 [Mycena capillaripes]|nr:hypothetical protein B0H19DRAFT_1275948 [Mycena capillaripes]
MQRALDRYDANIPPAKIYEIDQLEAMRIANLAWRAISAETIANCWRKTDILPSSSSAITAAIAAELEDAETTLAQTLDDLEERGVLQKRNRIDMEGLVNMLEEQVIEDATDEDIYEVVQQMRSDREDAEINGGDDGPGIPQDARPTRKEALEAVSTLCHYLMHEDGDFACKLELGLASFGRETRLECSKNLVSTAITDYFTALIRRFFFFAN